MGNCLTTALNTVQEVSETLQEQKQKQQQQQQNEQTHSTSQQQAHGSTFSTSSGGPSPIHPSLPAGAEKHHVRNVYDGDTLTLTDERRVRLLGIDTPEIKQKQPFAEEAKEYTKSNVIRRISGLPSRETKQIVMGASWHLLGLKKVGDISVSMREL
ncbi:nuclease-like protein [Fragilaria crotonensis]|nr:nuclease-like protein [Fragilaria crotonensis]